MALSSIPGQLIMAGHDALMVSRDSGRSWQKLGSECAPASLQELGEHAYPYEPYCNPKHHVCTNATDTCSRKAVDIASWQWVPQSCNLHHFSAEELDKKLAGRKVWQPWR